MARDGSWRTGIAAHLSLLCPSLAGCEPTVSARAVWVDVASDGTSQTIHVYDRGELTEFEVGTQEDVATVLLAPNGRGLMVRAGAYATGYFDLEDARRFPLTALVEFENDIRFSADGSALLWHAEAEFDGPALAVLPLSPGIPLERTAAGMQPLELAGEVWITARDAPIALVAEPEGTLGYWRWPTTPDEPLEMKHLASASLTGLEFVFIGSGTCSVVADCSTRLAIDPNGDTTIVGTLVEPFGPYTWIRFDRRSPELAGPLEFPTEFDQFIEVADIALVHLLDREHSLWVSGGLLLWWDHRSGETSALPVIGEGPFHVHPVERGAAVLLVAQGGPIHRADVDGLRHVSATTTACLPASAPIVSPAGTWVAWSCAETDAISELEATSGVVVRVSPLGLERMVGVPLRPLAIDDDGDLLLYSIRSADPDTQGGPQAHEVPKNLFVLSGDGAMSRIDELEPSPALAPIGGDVNAYIQAASLP